MMTLIQDYGADLLRAIGLHTIYVLISVVIGIPVGVISAVHRNSILDYLLMTVSESRGGCRASSSPFSPSSRPFPAWCSSACCSSGGGISIPR